MVLFLRKTRGKRKPHRRYCILMNGVPLVCGHAHDIAYLACPWAGHKHWTGLTIYLTFLIATDGSNRLISSLYCQCSILPVLNSANLVNLTPPFPIRPYHPERLCPSNQTIGSHLYRVWIQMVFILDRHGICAIFIWQGLCYYVFSKGTFSTRLFFFFSNLVLSVPVSVISGFSAISKRLRGRDRNSFS